MNRKRSTVSFSIAVDEDSQQTGDTGHDSIDLTPSHQVLDQLGSATPGPTSSESSTQAPKPQSPKQSALPSESQLSQQSTLAPDAGSSTFLTSSTHTLSQPRYHVPSTGNQQDQASQYWEANEWDWNVFDSDNVGSSLATMTKLAHELSILKDSLELYRQFNVYLGDVVSGPRHNGLIKLILSTVSHLESYTSHLRRLRNEKQRGNPAPGTMELVVRKISRKCQTRVRSLWDIMEEKVDMTNDVARATWLRKKRAVLEDVMDGMVNYLRELGPEEEWRMREVKEMREMREAWERRWRTFGSMSKEDLKAAGWILDVAT